MALSGEPTVQDWTLVNGLAWLQLWKRDADGVRAAESAAPVLRSAVFHQATVTPGKPSPYHRRLVIDIGNGKSTTTYPSWQAFKLIETPDPGGSSNFVYLVSVAGTANSVQWVQNVFLAGQSKGGYPPGTNPLPGTATAHDYFLGCAETFWPDLTAFMGPPAPGTRYVFVGHSLGGAVAQCLAAKALANGYGEVTCYAAGAPAVGNATFASYVAPVTWLLENDGDPVPGVAPEARGAEAGYADWFGLKFWADTDYKKLDPARRQKLNADGTRSPGGTDQGGAGVVKAIYSDFGARHVPDDYLARLGVEFLRPENLTRGAGGYDDPYRLAEVLAVKLPGEELPPAPPPPVPAYAGGPAFPAKPPGSPGPLPRHPPLPLPPPSKGVFMAAPADALSAPGYRVLMKFNMGSWGWTEHYVLHYATPTFVDALADASKLAQSRRAILNSDASIFGYRVQEYGGDPPHGSQFISDSALGCGPGEVDDELAIFNSTEPVWDTALVTLWDDTRQYRRTLSLRGVPSQWVVWKLSGDPGLTFEGEGPMTDFLAKLLSTDPNTGLKGRLAIYGRSKDAAATGRQHVNSAAINPRCGTDIVTNQQPAWAPGDVVHIHQAGCDQCHVPGLSGDSCVLDTNINQDGTFTTTVARRPCCCGTSVEVPSDTTIGKVVKAFYPIFNGSIGRLTSRATGAGFGAGRGRARSCRG